MIPLRDNQLRKTVPLLTYTIVALNLIIYLWDRQWRLFGPNLVFADLAMRPNDVIDSLKAAITRDPNGNLFPLVTVLTSMFMHGGPVHFLGNIIFLLVFGPGVEDAIGGGRFALYYMAWGLAAAATQIYIDPTSAVPTLGASGAIGGVMGCYFLLFPGNKIQIYIPLLPFWSFAVSAWILLGFWFLWQILIPQQGVANWAHVGGFLAGMLTVLVIGGRSVILKGRNSDPEVA
jgi:membrane associated rhomboid family serine protease